MMMRRILLGIMLFALVPLALAANDPGHDSLYVLKIGDSNVVGSINLTGNLNASFVKITQRLFGDYLDVVGNGTVLGSPSQPRIMGASNALYIDSTGNLYLNTKGGPSGIVQLGDTTTNAITLNVSGIIRQQNVAVCLSNGSNCISGTNGGNVTTVTAGSGLSNSGSASDPVLDVNVGDGISIASDTLIINNASVCRSNGVGCPSGATGSSGWINTSFQVYLANNASNVTVGYASSNPLVFVDTRNESVGFMTGRPLAPVFIQQRVNGTVLYVNASAQGGNADVPSVRIDGSDNSQPFGIYYASGVKYTDMIANSDPTQLSAIRMYNTSGSLAALLGSYPSGGKLILYNRSAFGAGVLLTSNVSETSWFMANVAIGDVTSTQKLTVIGNINVSGPGNIYYQGNLTGYGADLAEMVFSSGALEPGDVVIISDAAKTVELARVAYDTRVAGIVSTDPSHLMSAEEGDVPLALAGRVPVKVTTKNGPIRPGDLLTTSDVPGHAMRCASGCAGAIVGKAMEPLDHGQGMITALVVLG